MKYKIDAIKKDILKVHLKIENNYINPRNGTARAYPILESNMPHVNIRKLKKAERIRVIYRIIDWLNVEQSLRYLPSNGNTFCNIYAYDLAYFLGAYLPRVWWIDNLVEQILKGNTEPIAEYAKTLFELNCNGLFEWFIKYGGYFNWTKVPSFDILQTRVNEIGSIGFIIANEKRPGKAGHIAAIIPESKEFRCSRMFGKILSPLQSQAGIDNKKIFTNNNWWCQRHPQNKVGFWMWQLTS